MQVQDYKTSVHKKIANLRDPAKKFNSITKIQHPIRLQVSPRGKSISQKQKIKTISSNALIYKSTGLINVRNNNDDESFNSQNQGRFSQNHIDLNAKTFVEPFQNVKKSQTTSRANSFKINTNSQHLNYKMFDPDKSSNYQESDTNATHQFMPKSNYLSDNNYLYEKTPCSTGDNFYMDKPPSRGKSVKRLLNNDNYSTSRDQTKASSKTILHTTKIPASLTTRNSNPKTFDISSKLCRFYSNNLPVEKSQENSKKTGIFLETTRPYAHDVILKKQHNVISKKPDNYASTSRQFPQQNITKLQSNVFYKKPLSSSRIKKNLENLKQQKSDRKFEDLYTDQVKELGERANLLQYQNFIEKEKNQNLEKDFLSPSYLLKTTELPTNYHSMIQKKLELKKQANNVRILHNSDLINDQFAAINVKTQENTQFLNKSRVAGTMHGINNALNTKIFKELEDIKIEKQIQKNKKDNLIVSVTTDINSRTLSHMKKFNTVCKTPSYNQSLYLDELRQNQEEKSQFKIPVFLIPRLQSFNEYYFNKDYIDTVNMEVFDDTKQIVDPNKPKVSKWAKVRQFVRLNSCLRAFTSGIAKPDMVLDTLVMRGIGVDPNIDYSDLNQIEKALAIAKATNATDEVTKNKIITALNNKKRTLVLRKGSLASSLSEISPTFELLRKRKMKQRFISPRSSMAGLLQKQQLHSIRDDSQDFSKNKKRNKNKVSAFQQGRIRALETKNTKKMEAEMDVLNFDDLSVEADRDLDDVILSSTRKLEELKKNYKTCIDLNSEKPTEDNYSMQPRFYKDRNGREVYESYWMDCIHNCECEEYYWNVNDVGYYILNWQAQAGVKHVKSYEHGTAFREHENDSDFHEREDRYKSIYGLWKHLDADIENDDKHHENHTDIDEQHRLNEEDPDWVYEIPYHYPVNAQNQAF